MTKIYHTTGCNCGCNDGDKGSNRRDFLKKAGTVTGLGLAFGSITGGSLSSCSSDAKAVDKMNALKNGKAQRFTILQTADIHGQLMEHDEFFWENGKEVFKRRGGMATGNIVRPRGSLFSYLKEHLSN